MGPVENEPAFNQPSDDSSPTKEGGMIFQSRVIETLV